MAQLIIDIDKLRHNIQYLVTYCHQFGLEVIGILKGPGWDPVIIQEFFSNGVKNVGMSTLPLNKHQAEDYYKNPLFISLPSVHNIGNIIQSFGTSFNSELSVIKQINELSIEQGRSHNILLMVDTGDLREGVLPEDVLDMVRKIHEIENLKIKFAGIGTNLGCCAGMIPNDKNMGILNELVQLIEKELGLGMETVSIGGSLMLDWLGKYQLPGRINQIRLGEAIFLGNIPTIDQKHENLFDDVLIFRSDVLETKEKRVQPPSRSGKDALGYEPVFRQTGLRKRAVMNFGISETHPEGLTPMENGFEIVSVNSNYTVIDYTDFSKDLKPGDYIDFKINYIGMLQSFLSPFNQVVYKKAEG